MWKWIHRWGVPPLVYHRLGRYAAVLGWLAFVLLVVGASLALAWAPADYQQGNVYRIMFLHVPCAILSLGIYIGMCVAVVVFLVWKIKLADIVARVSAPLGAIFTVLTLVTGMLWGKPTWGTYWIWDARLTSELILLFIYIGIMLLRRALPNPQASSRAAGIVTLIGGVNIPIIHYSVVWWHTLHQGATILQWGRPTIAISMLIPLLVMIFAFSTYTAWWICTATRNELLRRYVHTHWVQQLAEDGP